MWCVELPQLADRGRLTRRVLLLSRLIHAMETSRDIGHAERCRHDGQQRRRLRLTACERRVARVILRDIGGRDQHQFGGESCDAARHELVVTPKRRVSRLRLITVPRVGQQRCDHRLQMMQYDTERLQFQRRAWVNHEPVSSDGVHGTQRSVPVEQRRSGREAVE